MHPGVGLFYQAMHADPLPHKISFLLYQTDTKITYSTVPRVHSSFTNILYFFPKQNAVLLKMLPWRKASKHPGTLKGTICTVQPGLGPNTTIKLSLILPTWLAGIFSWLCFGEKIVPILDTEVEPMQNNKRASKIEILNWSSKGHSKKQ